MGIDIYMSWDNMTEEEEESRYTGFSVTSGDVGYLREAYHGGPYATDVLVPEAFQHPDTSNMPVEEQDSFWEEYKGPQIPASTLRSRAALAMFTAIIREATVYNDAKAREFLGALGIEPAVGETDSPGIIETDTESGGVEALFGHLAKVFTEDIPKIQNGEGGDHEHALPAEFCNSKNLEAVAELFPVAKAYLDFVKLAERKEEETGKPVYILASY